MGKIKYIERRLIFVDDLKNLCADSKWYTMGDHNDFTEMLAKCKKCNITTDDIIEIAKDIHLHSDLPDMDFTELCFEISEITHTFFEAISVD